MEKVATESKRFDKPRNIFIVGEIGEQQTWLWNNRKII
jgi:hypothetical protein